MKGTPFQPWFWKLLGAAWLFGSVGLAQSAGDWVAIPGMIGFFVFQGVAVTGRYPCGASWYSRREGPLGFLFPPAANRHRGCEICRELKASSRPNSAKQSGSESREEV